MITAPPRRPTNRSTRASIRTSALVAASALLPAYAAHANTALDVYGVQEAAAEQPTVLAILTRPGDNSGDYLDPSNALYFQPYLDTGTSGILMSEEDTSTLGINNELAPDNTPVTFYDVAVNGTQGYNVSEPLNLQVGRYTAEDIDPSTFTLQQQNDYFNQTTSSIRSELNPIPSPDDGDPFGNPPVDLVGMPAMIGKVTVIDARLYNHWTGYDDNGNLTFDHALTSLPDFPTDPSAISVPQLQTWIYNKGQGFNPATPLFNPGVPNADFVVRLSYADLSRFTTLTPNEAGVVGPTFSHNPFIGPIPFTGGPPAPGSPPGITVSRTLTGTSTVVSTTGSWLLDTGAQVSFMSSAEALDLGVQLTYDSDGNPTLTDLETGAAPAGEFSVDLEGADGTDSTMLGFVVDQLDLPTTTGDIVFHDVPIGVLDVTVTDGSESYTLDGDFGMNLVLPSFDPDTLSLSSGPFDFVTFDEPDGELLLTNTTAGEVPEPATAGIVLMLGAASLLRRSRRGQAH